MVALSADIREIGWKAVDFNLGATNGKSYRLQDVAGPSGTLIMFICNHCPYVVGVIDRIVNEAGELGKIGIGVAAICSNDAIAYPDDSFPRMKVFADRAGFGFPYLHDETQQVARAYKAICTPDFFGFNSRNELQYRGRLDSAGRFAAGGDTRRDLYLAMEEIARTGSGPAEQVPSMGCSIKWRQGS